MLREQKDFGEKKEVDGAIASVKQRNTTSLEEFVDHLRIDRANSMPVVDSTYSGSRREKVGLFVCIH